MLPVLGALEDRRRGEAVVVIGVHSAKFAAEGDPARIADALARYGVRHPVVVDEGHEIWGSFAIRSWPTLVVLRPDGTIAAVAPGEADLGPLDAAVGKVLEEARAEGTLAREPLRIDALAPAVPEALAFPGKVIALPDGRLAVSDSGHHRVLVLDREGRVEAAVGSGAAGFADGPLGEARFAHPQGLAFDSESGLLFVADTGNHALREASLERGWVRTIAGTGALGRGMPGRAVPAREIALRSPWDLVVAGDWLLVAMAGTHQVWAYSLPEETIGVIAGSGRESIEDGAFPKATFAQPSGLALAGPRLYLADSETSAVRYLDLTRGEVRTLVGKGLFDFGDRDGPAGEALLQHPMGIAHGRAGLLVADTYNNKLKAVDEETGEVRTWFTSDGEVDLREPAGLCQLPDGRVVVADTNHHRLVEVSADGRSARVIPVEDVTPRRAVGATDDGAGGLVHLPAATVGPGEVTLRLRLEPPAGFDLAEGSRVSVRLSAGAPVAVPGEDQGFAVAGSRRGVPVRMRVGPEPAAAALDIRVEAVICGHGEGAACWPVAGAYRLPVRVEPKPAPAASLDATLRLPRP